MPPALPLQSRPNLWSLSRRRHRCLAQVRRPCQWTDHCLPADCLAQTASGAASADCASADRAFVCLQAFQLCRYFRSATRIFFSQTTPPMNAPQGTVPVNGRREHVRRLPMALHATGSGQKVPEIAIRPLAGRRSGTMKKPTANFGGRPSEPGTPSDPNRAWGRVARPSSRGARPLPSPQLTPPSTPRTDPSSRRPRCLGRRPLLRWVMR